MNRKQEILEKVIDIVVLCCNTKLQNGGYVLTKEQVLSPERIGEVADWTRCILVRQLCVMGYTTELIARVLNRSEATIRDKLKKGNDLDIISFAYHVAYSEATQRCKELIAEYKQLAETRL